MSLPTDPASVNPTGNDATTASGGGFAEDDWTMAPPPSMTTEEMRTHEELTRDLYKVEEEIRTLRQVLEAKERKAGVIRKKLGITPLQLMSKDVANSFKTIKESSGAAMQKMTGSDTVQKLNQSYAVQASKSAVSNAASYTKTGISTLGSGMKSSFGSFKTSLSGLGIPGTAGSGGAYGGGVNGSSVLAQDDAATEALFAGGPNNAASNSHGDQNKSS